MCINCPDFIDMCWNEECKISDNPYGGRPSFYIGDTYCKHLQEEYGHEKAQYGDLFGDDE